MATSLPIVHLFDTQSRCHPYGLLMVGVVSSGYKDFAPTGLFNLGDSLVPKLRTRQRWNGRATVPTNAPKNKDIKGRDQNTKSQRNKFSLRLRVLCAPALKLLFLPIGKRPTQKSRETQRRDSYNPTIYGGVFTKHDKTGFSHDVIQHGIIQSWLKPKVKLAAEPQG